MKRLGVISAGAGILLTGDTDVVAVSVTEGIVFPDGTLEGSETVGATTSSTGAGVTG